MRAVRFVAASAQTESDLVAVLLFWFLSCARVSWTTQSIYSPSLPFPWAPVLRSAVYGPSSVADNTGKGRLKPVSFPLSGREMSSRRPLAVSGTSSPGPNKSGRSRVQDGNGVQRRAMAGQAIPLFRTARNALQMYRNHRRFTGREVEICRQRYDFLAQLLERSTGRPVHGACVLEVGCGQRAVMPLLFAARGAKARAVDVEAPTFRMSVKSFFKVLRSNGLHRVAKSAFRHALFDHRFFVSLEKTCGVVLHPFPAIDVNVVDAARAQLPRDEFDMVFSFNVMEHIVDVESTVRDINAALKPDGVGYVRIHLFPSLSGGHCPDWQYAPNAPYPEWGIPTKVAPWDHLRENLYPPDSFLNRMRLSDYRVIFRRHTVVVREDCEREGVDLLPHVPPELLLDYTEEDLTTAFVAFTFRKGLRAAP